MTELLIFGAGFVTGWIVFQRPVLVTELFNAAKAKIKALFSGQG